LLNEQADLTAGGHGVEHNMHGSQTFPISIKGVVVRDGKVLLLRNERECVTREIHEETQWKVVAGPILDTWMYYINVAEKHVFIVTYGCHPIDDTQPVLSHEHKEIGLFSENEVSTLVVPDGYKRSIAAWYERLRKNTSTLAR
jgi:8-oxo-dGTP pyrophosphatase MutT (NUDIX family)